MFRLFLRKKILSAAPLGKQRLQRIEDEGARRNRRIFERYSIDHKHLTLMNEQDILLVREISAKGFSTEVSQRGYDRFTLGDVYEARIRYLGEIYDLAARVSWKHDGFVGFELVKTERETLMFLKRLLRPIEIASSLKPVETSYMNEGTQAGKTWYHGDEDTDLYTWHDPGTGRLRAWQLVVGGQYIEWSEAAGFTTGLLKSMAENLGFGDNLKGLSPIADVVPDPDRRRLAVDVMMALGYPVREEIMETLA